MSARSSVKPRKAQVKDKGLGAKSGDFEGWVAKMGVKPDFELGVAFASENGLNHRHSWAGRASSGPLLT